MDQIGSGLGTARARQRGLSAWIVIAGLLMAPVWVDAAPRSHHHEKIEWTWSDRPEVIDDRLPNVLLIGDSITRNYYEPVEALLKGKANVYLFATSVSAGDERLGPQISDYLKSMQLPFAVVHLNNGMHGAAYTDSDYETYYPEMFAALTPLPARPKCVVATTTPVRKALPDTPTNAQIDHRNAIATHYAAQFGCQIDDQHALMAAHQDLHSDDVHFGPAGSALQATQVAGTIETALGGGAK